MTPINQPIVQPKKKMGVGKKLLIGFGVLIFIAMIANGDNDKKTEVLTPTPNEVPNLIPSSNSSTTASLPIIVDKEQEEEDAMKNKLKAKAKRDWPDDYTTQEFWVNEEIEAYRYMKTIPEGGIKRKAQHDWPLDFSTQKFWYNEQIEAQERMK